MKNQITNFARTGSLTLLGSFSTIWLMSFFSFSSINIIVISKLSAFESDMSNLPTHSYSAAPTKTSKMPLNSSYCISVFLKYDSIEASGIYFK
jgi:hypothetical protein